MNRPGLLALVPFSALAFLAAGAGCSLGLDKALIGTVADSGVSKDGTTPKTDAGPDAEAAAPDSTGVSDAPGTDTPVVDSSSIVETSAPMEGGVVDATPTEASTSCATDADCKSSNACLTGRCVTATGTCAFDLCPPSMCAGSTCDTTIGACGLPQAYTFTASTIAMPAGVSCVSTQDCIAAEFPFVYVGTTQGVYAITVSDPSNPMPAMTPVGGIPFFPTAIVQSGTRVYFVGPLQTAGASMTYMLPIAWIDPPADPTRPLVASSSFAVYPSSPFSNAFAGGTLGLFVETDLTAGPNDAIVTAPLPNPYSVTLFPTPLAMPGEEVIGASQSNLVTFRFDSTSNDANFALVQDPGSASAQNLGEQDVSAVGFGQVQTYWSFATGPDGSVLFSAANFRVAMNNWGEVRFNWVLADATQTTFSSAFVTVQPYSPPVGSTSGDQAPVAPLAGPLAWLDPNRAMVLSATNMQLESTTVSVVTRAMTPPTVLTQSAVLTAPTNATGAAGAQSTTSSDSFGYVLSADSPTAATLHIFAPDCMQ